MFDSVRLAGLVTFAALAPAALAQLHAGAFVDRAERRTVLVWTEIARSIVLASLVVAIVADALHVVHLLVALGIDGVLAVVSRLTERSALPLVVDADVLSTAYSLNEARLRVATLTGPPLAGLLIAIGAFAPFLAYCAATAASALLCVYLRGPLRSQQIAQRTTYAAEIREGYLWLRSNRFFWWTAWILLATNMIGIAFPLIVITRLQAMGSGTTEIGLVLGVLGIGGLIGIAVSRVVADGFRPCRVFTATRWMMALGLLAAALAPTPVLMAATLPIISVGAAVSNVSLGVARLEAIPENLRARVDSLSTLIANTFAPLGALGAGFLVGEVGPTWAALAIAIGMVCVATLAGAVPVVRSGGPPARLAKRASTAMS